ncbi:hypothetical protein [Paenibacillus aestuarii]|uniref:Glycosyl-hydrolase family 116 catalytic region domain-containing protein n=1 Tax=Paenibacillus aestuarii TaxID=516965 RepID=A0ABW0KEP9_9BACL|nr:hypothetical protein [Paenibacillus aestuarii]
MQQSQDRWSLSADGGIVWELQTDSRLPHTDHLEMSGKKVSVIVRYGVDAKGELILSRKLVWPGLRTIPNDTHASLIRDFGLQQMPQLYVSGKAVTSERPVQISFDGFLHICSTTDRALQVSRTLFPSTDAPSCIEKITVINPSSQPVLVRIVVPEAPPTVKGTAGIYVFAFAHSFQEPLVLQPHSSYTYYVSISAYPLRKQEQLKDYRQEEEKRRALVVQLMHQDLQLETPEPVLNRMFAFAKLRAAESIFQTKGGLMHGPGGGSYYAAVWTNDQIEYAAPFFAYLGYPVAHEATMNAMRLYMPFMGPDFQPIPSSIIAEGVDIWEGAGDRGDAAMYAYGASLYALTLGDRDAAEELWPAIVWCLAYCDRKRTSDGVIASDSDELEGRFPSGDANLATSCLAYSGYALAAKLAASLAKPADSQLYSLKAEELKAAIDSYFGAKVEGYETYRYYEGNTILRSWICLPLTVGMMERREGTIQALLSPRLWSEEGVLTQAGDTTYWDRSTLYSFRGMLAAGEVNQVLPYLQTYARRRLLGDHVPYAVEAYPEGNQRHLSAESALWCRVVIEGLFGIMPTGLRQFTCSPRLPADWERMELRSIRAFGRIFDIVVERHVSGLRLTALNGAQVIEMTGTSSGTFHIQLV